MQAPSVELLGVPAFVAGAAAAATALARFGFSSRGLVAACFLGALSTLAVIDYQHHLLPNKIVVPAAALVLALQVALFPDQALEWVLASLGTFSALLVLALIRPGGLGMGDVKLGLLLGAGLGVQVVGAVAIGCAAILACGNLDPPSPRLGGIQASPAVRSGARLRRRCGDAPRRALSDELSSLATP